MRQSNSSAWRFIHVARFSGLMVGFRMPARRPRRIVSMVTGPGGALNEMAMMAPASAVEGMLSPVGQNRDAFKPAKCVFEGVSA